MAKVLTMQDLKNQVIDMSIKEPDLIPLLTDVGIGNHYAPSKKTPAFRVGEVRIPAEALKPEFQKSLHYIDKLIIKTIVFIPKDMASDKVLDLLKEETNEDAQASV